MPPTYCTCGINSVGLVVLPPRGYPIVSGAFLLTSLRLHDAVCSFTRRTARPDLQVLYRRRPDRDMLCPWRAQRLIRTFEPGVTIPGTECTGYILAPVDVPHAEELR